MPFPEPVDVLRSAGLRITAPRVAALRQLARRSHVSADEVSAAVRAELGAVSTQAIYDALRVFTEAGIVRRFEPAGSPARYELRVGDNHQHLVCRACGAVEDVEGAVGAVPCLEPPHDHGFTVEVAEVTFWGICPRCRADAAHPTDPIRSDVEEHRP